MAAGTNTIREFLVALGFKVDEQSMKKFTGGIDKATKAVFALAAAVEATALTVAYGVQKFASNLEQLYFTSQRTGTAVINLKAMDKAAQSLGVSAGTAVQQLDAMAELIRYDPGKRSLLESLIGPLKKAADGTDDMNDAVLRLQASFRSMSPYVAKSFAQQLGITDDVFLRAILSGKLGEQFEHMRRGLGGVDWDKAAKDAHEFENQIRDLQTTLEAFGLRVLDALQNKLGFSVEKLNKWLRENGPHLAEQIADAVGKIWCAAEYLMTKLMELYEFLKKLDDSTNGWSTKLIALAVLLGVTGLGSVIGGVVSLAAAFVSLTGGITAAVAALAAFVGYDVFNALRGKGSIIGGWVDSLVEKMTGKKGQTLGGWLYEITHRDKQAYEFFRNKGWSSAQTAGIVANLRAESGLSASAVGDNNTSFGLAQWHDPKRLLDFKKLFGHDIRNSTFEEQLGFVDWELRNRPEFGGDMLKRAQFDDQSARLFAQYYERPKNFDYEADRRAHLAQQITINIDGAQDPKATAAAVAATLHRNNSDLQRTAASYVR